MYMSNDETMSKQDFKLFCIDTGEDNQPKMYFVKTHPDAHLPERAHSSDSGYDVYSVEDVVVPGTGSIVVPVGLTLGFLTKGWWFRVEPRSGLGFKHNLQPHLGIIDNGYRGDLGIKLYNFSNVNVTLIKGTKVAQLVLYPHVVAEVGYIEETIDADRGDAGFGSTDTTPSKNWRDNWTESAAKSK